MIRPSTLALAFAAAALSAQSASAAPPNAKLWNGTWHLDAAASKWAVGKGQSETRSYDFSGGKLTMKSSATDAAGKKMDFSYSAGCDGKSAAMVGNPNADSISINCVSAREIKATSRMKGKVTVQSTAMVSPDGKHMTLKRTYVARKGSPTEVLQYTR
jgi:opacity protein-like surface antigen